MFSDEVKAILVAANVTTADKVFIGAKTSLPAPGAGAFVTIRVEGGTGPEGTHNDGPLAYVRPGAQVVARADKYSDAERMALAALAAIAAVRNQFVGGTWWRQVRLTQSEPFDIGEDQNARPRLAFNFTCVKRQSNS